MTLGHGEVVLLKFGYEMSQLRVKINIKWIISMGALKEIGGNREGQSSWCT